MSDPFVKLSDVERKSPDILSDQSETEDYCLSDPSRTVALSAVVNQNVYPSPGQEACVLNGASE